MGSFFADLDAICSEQNAALDEMYANQAAIEEEKARREAAEEVVRQRTWALQLLEDGTMPVAEHRKITRAMFVIIDDREVSRPDVARLLVKNEQYRQFIHSTMVKQFLEQGGESVAAGEFGTIIIKRGLEVEAGVDLIEKSELCERVKCALLVLGCFDPKSRPEIAGVISLLRRKFPFTRGNDLPNLPKSLGIMLYPERFTEEGRCTFQFGGVQQPGIARRVPNPNWSRMRPEREENPRNDQRRPTPINDGKRDQKRSGDMPKKGPTPEELEDLELARSGQIPGVRLVSSGD